MSDRRVGWLAGLWGLAAFLLGGGWIGGWASVFDAGIGLALGLVSTAEFVWLLRRQARAGGSSRPIWLIGIHLLKYPLILAVLYWLLVIGQRNALAVVGGYTLALAVVIYAETKHVFKRAKGTM